MKVRTPKTTVLKDNFDEQLEYIMQNFDFDLVAEYMSWDKSRREYNMDGICINKGPWTMLCPTDHKIRIPNITDLKCSAESLLKEVIEKYRKQKSDLIYIHCGPFKASCNYGILNLDCIIESWGND